MLIACLVAAAAFGATPRAPGTNPFLGPLERAQQGCVPELPDFLHRACAAAGRVPAIDVNADVTFESFDAAGTLLSRRALSLAGVVHADGRFRVTELEEVAGEGTRELRTFDIAFDGERLSVDGRPADPGGRTAGVRPVYEWLHAPLRMPLFAGGRYALGGTPDAPLVQRIVTWGGKDVVGEELALDAATADPLRYEVRDQIGVRRHVVLEDVRELAPGLRRPLRVVDTTLLHGGSRTERRVVTLVVVSAVPIDAR